jgi:hypothetical protein
MPPIAIAAPSSAIAVIAIVFYVNICLAKRHISNWGGMHVFYFVVSMGQFGQKQIALLEDRCGMNRNEASVFIKYQLYCLIELPLCMLFAFMTIVHAVK